MNENAKAIVFTHYDASLCGLVSELLVSSGFASEYGTSIPPADMAGYRIHGKFVSWSSRADIYSEDDPSYGLYYYPFRFDARTQMAELREYLMTTTKPETERKKLPVIIKVHGDAELSKQVQSILMTIGVSFSNAKKIEAFKSSALLANWNIYPDPYLYHDGNSGPAAALLKEKPHALVFDARTQMLEIMQHFTGKIDLSLEMLVSPALIQFIKSSHGDETVAGFIRRDLGMVLPEAVQKNGADSIFNWIMENKIQAVPLKIHKPEPHILRLHYKENVSGLRRWSRTDIVTVEIEVPVEVVNRAIAENDWSVAENWMVEHRSNGLEVGRVEGEDEDGDSLYDQDYEFYEVCEDQPELYAQLEQLDGRT